MDQKFRHHPAVNLTSMYPAHMIKICLTVAALMLSSCSSLQSTEDDSISRPFTAADAQHSNTIAPNRVFTIELQGNPTTGYEWSLSVEPKGVVSIKSKEFIADASGRVGVGGIMSWKLSTKKVGTTTMKFSYSRPWETDVKPAREIVFNFKVR
jgi:predicted secreted protein